MGDGLLELLLQLKDKNKTKKQKTKSRIVGNPLQMKKGKMQERRHVPTEQSNNDVQEHECLEKERERDKKARQRKRMKWVNQKKCLKKESF